MIKWLYDEHEFHSSDQAAAGEKQDPEIQLQEIAAEVIKQGNATMQCSFRKPNYYDIQIVLGEQFGSH